MFLEQKQICPFYFLYFICFLIHKTVFKNIYIYQTYTNLRTKTTDITHISCGARQGELGVPGWIVMAVGVFLLLAIMILLGITLERGLIDTFCYFLFVFIHGGWMDVLIPL